MMNSRRKFFSSLIVPLAVVATAATGGSDTSSAASTSTQTVPDELIYYGFRLRWTGWKKDQGSLRLSGQWMGIHTDPRIKIYVPYMRESLDCLVATSGGVQTESFMWSEFSQVETSGRSVTINTPQTELDRIQQLTLKEIKEMVHKAILVGP